MGHQTRKWWSADFRIFRSPLLLRVYLALAKWLSCYQRDSIEMLSAGIAIALLSVRLSVRLSHASYNKEKYSQSHTIITLRETCICVHSHITLS